MKIWRDFTNLPAEARGAVVALGNFDGLHLGHRKVLDAARALAKAKNAPLAVMTFDPHPRRLFNPQLPILRIVSLAERMRLLKDAGVEHVFLQHFTKNFAATSAQDFIEKILMQQLQVAGVVTGDNFCFGHKRGGNSALLTRYSEEASITEQGDARSGGGSEAMGVKTPNKYFAYDAVEALQQGGEVCSSTRIRSLLAVGKMQEVATLLTRPYAITGKVQKGDQRGRKWGFPTANVALRKMFYPAYGIYAVRLTPQDTGYGIRGTEEDSSPTALVRDSAQAHCAQQEAQRRSNHKSYKGVASFGIRPMYPLDKPLLEVHVLDASPDLYGKIVKVELLHYLRPEARFDDEAALRAQIAQDCDDARNYFL